MEITRKTIRKSLSISVDDINKIKHEIYAFANNNSENIYFLIGEPMNAEIYILTLCNSITKNVDLQYYIISKDVTEFFDISKKLNKIIKYFNKTYNIEDFSPNEFKTISKNKVIKKMHREKRSRIVNVCKVFNGDLVLDLDHKYIFPNENNRLTYEMRFSLIGVPYIYDQISGLKEFLAKKGIISYKVKICKHPDLGKEMIQISLYSHTSRREYNDILYFIDLEKIIKIIKEFVNSIERNSDFEDIFKSSTQIDDPTFRDCLKNIIRQNLSKVKGNILFRLLEELESKYQSNPDGKKYMIKCSIQHSSIYVKIYKQGCINARLFDSYFKYTNANELLLRNIIYLYSNILITYDSVLKDIEDIVYSHANTMYSGNQNSIGINYISIGLFPLISKNKLPKLPDGWDFDLQRFVYTTKDTLNDDILNIVNEFINWLIDNTEYFDKEKK